MALFSDILDRFKRKAPPQKTLGGPGVAVYGGYIDEGETNADLAGRQKYITYTEMLANTSIVAASVRYALNLIAKAGWKVEAADDSEEAKEIAEWFDHEIHHMSTPWHRVVRRAASYRQYGFSIQEWTAKRNEDGTIGIKDVEPRPQHTIEQWGLDESGTVVGVVQRPPQDWIDRDLPRGKLVYVVDDSISDSPEGLGLFRHVVEAVRRLREYERLEGIGFETDLRGIPVGRAPVTSLQQMVKQGQLSEEQANAQLNALRNFLKSHKKTANLALLLDSRVYESSGDTKTPSGQQQWGMELLTSGATTAPELALAIQRLNREIARVLGTENILLGESGAGSLAMSKDKSDQFALVVDSTLKELAETFQKDLVVVFMKLNGWDEALTPTLKPDRIQYRSVEEITAALRDMASAGAMMAPDDPAINEIRDMLGLSQVDLEALAEDAALQADLDRRMMEAKIFGEQPPQDQPGSEPKPTEEEPQ
jgi:hypothetical protein